MSEELKPCPFCGGKAQKAPIAAEWWTTYWGVQCANCGCESPGYIDYNKAVEVWNRRANDETD